MDCGAVLEISSTPLDKGGHPLPLGYDTATVVSQYPTLQ